MGTPDFARTILERLVADGHDVCGVFTQPDKPRNRNKVTPSPVKEYALSQNIPVFQPVTMRDGTALEDFKTLAPGTRCARKKGIEAACGDGKSILITELQPDGGKRMAANAFLNGKRIAAGTVLDA